MAPYGSLTLTAGLCYNLKQILVLSPKCNIFRRVRDVLFEFQLKFWNTASIGIPVRSKVDRLLSALTAQQKGTTARWY